MMHNEAKFSMAVPEPGYLTPSDTVNLLSGKCKRSRTLLKQPPDSATLNGQASVHELAIPHSELSPRDTLSSLSGLEAVLKRTLDITAGSIALLLFLPLLLIVAIVIKLDSKGSALYRQPRTGINGRIFEVYKFRTMHSNVSQQFVQAAKNDPRITRVGGFLRRTSLDELPQLLNVIEGTMSLVGPRPHPLKLDEQFKQQMPLFDSRYMVKPGITGLAQVKGYRGETREAEAMAKRIQYDRLYIAQWSIALDIKLLMVTAVKGWVHKNAY